MEWQKRVKPSPFDLMLDQSGLTIFLVSKEAKNKAYRWYESLIVAHVGMGEVRVAEDRLGELNYVLAKNLNLNTIHGGPQFSETSWENAKKNPTLLSQTPNPSWERVFYAEDMFESLVKKSIMRDRSGAGHVL